MDPVRRVQVDLDYVQEFFVRWHPSDSPVIIWVQRAIPSPGQQNTPHTACRCRWSRKLRDGMVSYYTTQSSAPNDPHYHLHSPLIPFIPSIHSSFDSLQFKPQKAEPTATLSLILINWGCGGGGGQGEMRQERFRNLKNLEESAPPEKLVMKFKRTDS